jgi:hypothetical protein
MTKIGKVTASDSTASESALKSSTAAAIERLKLIQSQIKDLDPTLKERGIVILLEREFGTAVGRVESKPPLPHADRTEANESDRQLPFSAFVEKWTPETEGEWALLGAYYQSQVLGQETFASQAVNSQLKQHGNGVSNITRAFTVLASAKPALILQVKKTGTSKQGRKFYRITTQGIRVIEEKVGLTGSG